MPDSDQKPARSAARVEACQCAECRAQTSPKKDCATFCGERCDCELRTEPRVSVLDRGRAC